MTIKPSHLFVRQATSAVFHALVGECPAVVMVLQGRKRIQRGGSWTAVVPGQLVVLPADEPLTIENWPPPDGPYMASAIALGAETLPVGDPTKLATDDRAIAAFRRAAAALEDPLLPAPLRDHAVAEVLLWLAQEGVGLPRTRAQGLVPRLRALLANDLAAAWTAPLAAHSLAMSEATLRRRLAAAGLSFGDLLADLRMTRALGMLQITTQPVSHVAAEVGYGCASRFAARFRARFGLSPSAIRTKVAGNGIAIDRIGAKGLRTIG